MTLPSGAHVKLGSYEFMLAVDEADHYHDSYESLYEQGGSIDGDPGKRSASPRVLYWRLTDWSGGEDVKYFTPDDPTTYYYGQVNPRVPGSLTSPPDLTATTSLTTTTAAPDYLVMVTAAGTLWLLANRQLFYSTNGTSWTAHGSNPIGVASDMITAACSTGDEIWYSTINSTTREVWKATTASVTQAVSDVTGPKALGMAMLEGFVYLWTGKNLLRYSARKTLPITQADKHKVHKAFTDSPSGTYYGDCIAAENSVIYFIAYKGETTILEFRRAGAPLWYIPGFTAKGIAYKMGVLAVLGEEDGKCVLLGMNLKTRQTFKLANVGRYRSAVNARSISPGPGSTFLMTVDDGTTTFVYSYDLALDAISEVDEQTISSKGTSGECIYYDSRRLVAYYSSTTIKADSWANDDSTPSGSWTWVSGAHDLNYPMDQKVLLGISVMNDQSIAAGNGTVYYDLDETGSFTSAGTWAAASKHTFIDLSSTTKKFRTIRFKVTGASGARLLSIAARTSMNTTERTWLIKVKLNRENWGDSPTNRKRQVHILRTYLKTLITDQNVVTFLDGFRFPGKGGSNDGSVTGGPTGYTTHTVVIDALDDRIDTDGEGVATLVLRQAVPT